MRMEGRRKEKRWKVEESWYAVDEGAASVNHAVHVAEEAPLGADSQRPRHNIFIEN